MGCVQQKQRYKPDVKDNLSPIQSKPTLTELPQTREISTVQKNQHPENENEDAQDRAQSDIDIQRTSSNADQYPEQLPSRIQTNPPTQYSPSHRARNNFSNLSIIEQQSSKRQLSNPSLSNMTPKDQRQFLFPRIQGAKSSDIVKNYVHQDQCLDYGQSTVENWDHFCVMVYL